MKRRLQELAAQSNGQAYDPNLEAPGVMASLDRIQDSGHRNSKRRSQIRDIVSNTLKVVQTVGNLLVDVASQVFAPATPCFNAINFVICAWQGYQSVYDTLKDLFGECTGFLDRLPEYARGGMNKSMSNIVCRALRHFVEVCERAVLLRSSRWFKTKTALGIAFLSRNEFKDLTDKMNSLTSSEAKQAVATMYANTGETNRNVKINTQLLVEEAEDRELTKQESKDKSRILETLAFDPKSQAWDPVKGEPSPTWRTTYQNILQQRVPGTGEWLFKHHHFTAWADKGDKPILGIVGGEATGKSFLIASAIHHLRNQDLSKNLSSRRLVGLYFLDSRKVDSRPEGLGKSIIWQFALSDASYMRAAAAACSKGAIDPKELLTRLLTNKDELNQIDITFFIVINKIGGSDNTVDDALVAFLKKVAHLEKKSVRVLFSTSTETINKLTKSGLKVPTIPLDSTTVDMSKYIDNKLKKMDHVAPIRQKVHDKLLARGNYYLINNDLQEISRLDYDEEIFDFLDGRHDSLTVRIDRDIQQLNTHRTDRERKEINTMIRWITFARERMSAERMKTVLQLEKEATSLRPLEERLTQKFLLFEIDNDGYISFRSDQIAEKLKERSRNLSKREKDNTVVQNGEVDIVRHFFKTVCPPNLIEKLELEKHFQDKLHSGKENVYVEDPNTANFELARASLQVLAGDETGRLRVLRGYAARNLISHMSEAQLGVIDRGLKEKAGCDLVKLFHNGPAIDNNFWAKEETPHFPKWFFNQEAVDVVCRWLGEASTLIKHGEKEEKWLREILGGGGNMVQLLIEPSIIRMAENCFRMETSEDNTLAAFAIVEQFTSNVEAWCLHKLQVKKAGDSLWHCQMAFVLNGACETAASQARCRRALALDDDNWRASFLLATTLGTNTEAKDILKDLLRHHQGNRSWMEQNKLYFADMAYRLGAWYWTTQQHDKAMKWFSTFAEQGTDQFTYYFDIISYYFDEDDWASITGILKGLLPDSRLTRMAIALENTPRNEKFDRMILQYMVHTEDFAMLDSIYPEAIATSNKSNNHRACFHFRRAYAIGLSAKPVTPLETIMELLLAAAKDVPYSGLNMPDALFRVGYRLATIYLDKAKQANDNDAEAESWLRKISEIVPEQVSEDQMRLPLRLFAARYHVIKGNEKAARQAAHNSLRMAAELLADSDASNDLLAYSKILYAVTPFGDENHARAATYMIKSESGPGGYQVYCSCKCGKRLDDPGDQWRCKDCIKVMLRPECKENVKKGVIGHVCQPGHDHFPIHKWTGKDLDKGVPWKDRIISLDHWREKLIRDYRLS
ncbi:hypothetical protein BJY01DRAFT_230757 [Aspergillus pseudoustus]|uniref:Fungal STAND N-terminal Goodbye domain-containing protein n=1 Tax=Aspergillus pseudoustus TaxID=1810923 RepID=A0ABR4L253_9EURO